MARLSISEAATQAGISRTNLYKNYINKGVLTVGKNAKNKPFIDSSEILRVFGDLQGVRKDDNAHNEEIQKVTVEKHTETQVLENEIHYLKQLLAEKDKRIDDIQEKFLLLENTSTHSKRKKRGVLGRVVRAALDIE